MDIAEKNLEEFIAIWYEEFHETLTIADARQHATQLLELYAVLARALPAPPNHEATTSLTTDEILSLLPEIDGR